MTTVHPPHHRLDSQGNAADEEGDGESDFSSGYGISTTLSSFRTKSPESPTPHEIIAFLAEQDARLSRLEDDRERLQTEVDFLDQAHRTERSLRVQMSLMHDNSSAQRIASFFRFARDFNKFRRHQEFLQTRKVHSAEVIQRCVRQNHQTRPERLRSLFKKCQNAQTELEAHKTSASERAQAQSLFVESLVADLAGAQEREATRSAAHDADLQAASVQAAAQAAEIQALKAQVALLQAQVQPRYHIMLAGARKAGGKAGGAWLHSWACRPTDRREDGSVTRLYATENCSPHQLAQFRVHPIEGTVKCHIQLVGTRHSGDQHPGSAWLNVWERDGSNPRSLHSSRAWLTNKKWGESSEFRVQPIAGTQKCHIQLVGARKPGAQKGASWLHVWECSDGSAAGSDSRSPFSTYVCASDGKMGEQSEFRLHEV